MSLQSWKLLIEGIFYLKMEGKGTEKFRILTKSSPMNVGVTYVYRFFFPFIILEY